MAIRQLMQRWIEVLTGLYLAYLETRNARRAVLIACDGDRFAVRTVTPKAGADTQAMQPDEAGEGAVLSVLKPGKRIPGKVARAAEGGLVLLELPAAEVVVRHISVPAQAREFLAGIVRNQLERLSPWHSDQAAYGFDAEVNGEDPANLDVRVLITSRTAIDGFRDKLAAMGLTIDRAVVRQSQAEITKFVTLWSRLAALSSEDLDLARRRIVGGIAALILLSVVISVGALTSAASLRAASDETAGRSKTLQRQMEGPGARSLAALKPGERAWYQKETASTAAIVIEAASRALPDSAYLTELHLDGVTLRMIGLTTDATSLIAPLEQSGHLADVHFFAPTTRDADGTRFRFHIEARVKPQVTIAETP